VNWFITLAESTMLCGSETGH